MAITLRPRKPDSGLGNIRSSPSDPSRNIDWVLMGVQMCLAVVGCFVIYSASRTKQLDPFQYATRQVVFLIVAIIAMVVVMAVDYESLRERARFFYGVTIMLLVLVILAGTVSGGARLSLMRISSGRALTAARSMFVFMRHLPAFGDPTPRA